MKKRAARQYIIDNYSDSLQTTPMPEKYPTLPQPAESCPGIPRAIKWNFSLQTAETYHYNAGLFTQGEYDRE